MVKGVLLVALLVWLAAPMAAESSTELGKRLAKNVEATTNPATKALLARINKLR